MRVMPTAAEQSSSWSEAEARYAGTTRPADGRLKGDDNQPHEISDYIATRYFGDGKEMRIAEPRNK